MPSKPTTTTGKIKVNFALRPQAYQLLVEMSRSTRSRGDFLSDLIQAEAHRRRAPDLAERVEALEEQIAALYARAHPSR